MLIEFLKECFKGAMSRTEVVTKLLNDLNVLGKLLSDGRHYLMGSKPSIPDFVLF